MVGLWYGMEAINKKHQSKVNKAIRAILTYNLFNSLRDIANDEGNEKEFKILDKKCEKYFNSYLEIKSELPKREVEQIEKKILLIMTEKEFLDAFEKSTGARPVSSKIEMHLNPGKYVTVQVGS